MVIDKDVYTKKDEHSFINELKARLGHDMKIFLEYVPIIDKERSGKFKLIKSFLVKGKDYDI